ncbi:MAG: RecQ family ATP-dependent DNA helicase [Paludibacteraceae bacterium]|nr:RecQ family ATP-dependent DNA helicase [Paludibacteraceae bacterium]
MTPQEVLHKYFGYESFRPLQEEIISSVLEGRDTLALMPTGGGKSLCFQVPTMVLAEEGKPSLCLVITPLIALMKDQVENLKKRDILAAAIYSGMRTSQQAAALDNCQFGPYHFLYVSPERLENEDFRKRLAELPIGLIAVDEAHCISQWGYDFRPSYLHIAQVRELIPCPLLALTATATPKVVEDICERLEAPSNSPYRGENNAKKMNVFTQSFERKNLQYVVRRTDDKWGQLQHILSKVPGSAIVYVRNRKRAEDLAQALPNADFYHAGLTSLERSTKQQTWKEGKRRIMVCTNAFGMGIDKPDVRLVIHYDIPDSIEAYFQEAGRAGRDGQTAYAVLLYDPTDKTKVRKRVTDSYPSKEFIEEVYHKTCDYLGVGAGSGLGHSFALHIEDLLHVMSLPLLPTYSALHILSNAGYIDFEEDQEMRARVQLRITTSQWKEYSLSPSEQELLETLMRRYTGIFAELQYIDLEAEGQKGGEAERLLSGLAARGILTYIPRTCACRFTFVQERQESIFLPKRVYDDRKDQYVERLSAMVHYAEQTELPPSQVLLHYFGQ